MHNARVNVYEQRKKILDFIGQPSVTDFRTAAQLPSHYISAII